MKNIFAILLIAFFFFAPLLSFSEGTSIVPGGWGVEVAQPKQIPHEDLGALFAAHEDYEIVVDPLAAKTTIYEGYNVRALYDVNDIIWAIETLINYAKDDLDGPATSYAVYLPPEMALRAAADRIEKKRADIARAQKILDALKE